MEATVTSSSSAAIHPALLSQSLADDELASAEVQSSQADGKPVVAAVEEKVQGVQTDAQSQAGAGPEAQAQAAQAAAAAPPAVQSIESWIQEQSAAGQKPAALYKSMLGVGWSEDAAFEKLLRSAPAIDLAVGRAKHGQWKPMPEPRLDGLGSSITLPDRKVEVLLQMRNPRVVVFGGFMSDEECDELIELASPKMERSTTLNNEDGSSVVHEVRTSDGMFFQRNADSPAVVRRIEERIAALLNWPVDHGEGMQVLRYRPGAEYRPHHDYFDPAYPGSTATLKRGGQRVGTFLMYLNTPDAGGSTTFPDVEAEVRAIKGHAVFFSYDCPHSCSRTLHAGAPVLEGVKWAATKWLRQGVFI